jgi:hypothetical protein
MIQAALPKISLPTADPGIFSGRKTESVKAYIENYEAAGDANRWNSEIKKQYLPFYLRETARKWYNGFKDEIDVHQATWQEVKTALEEAFDNSEYKELLEIKLLNRRRLEGERLESYIYDVLDMCRQIDDTMPDKLRIRHVRRGLNSDLYDSLAAASQSNLKEFLSAVKGAEALRFLKKEKNQPTELIPPATSGVTVNNIQQFPTQQEEKTLRWNF